MLGIIIDLSFPHWLGIMSTDPNLAHPGHHSDQDQHLVLVLLSEVETLAIHTDLTVSYNLDQAEVLT